MSIALKEQVRIHNLVSLRVAQVLDLFVVRRLPWIFETPAISQNQLSIAHLDEYVNLLKLPEAKHQVGVQRPCGSLSSKPTSWVFFLADLTDMTPKCQHPKRTWFNDSEGPRYVLGTALALGKSRTACSRRLDHL